MNSNRTDLNRSNSNPSYLILTIILVILSSVGVYFLFQPKTTPVVDIEPIVDIEPVVEPTPTIIDTKPSEVPKTTPVVSTTPVVKTTPVVDTKPIVDTKPSEVPTPTFLNFSSSSDKFSVTYSSNRKLYQDTESSGNRYTFYHSNGNIVVHSGSQWSWVHPDRQFTTSLLISGKPTFVYQIYTQKIIDFENSGIKYTIQCIHSGLKTLIDECDQFVANFTLL